MTEPTDAIIPEPSTDETSRPDAGDPESAAARVARLEELIEEARSRIVAWEKDLEVARAQAAERSAPRP